MSNLPDRLVLGIDGGGSKTAAVVGRDIGGTWRVAGRGRAGPSNPRAIGHDEATRAITEAIGHAFADATLGRQTVASAVIGLAGAGDPQVREQVAAWALSEAIAHRVVVVHDAWPVLRAGTPAGRGVALIVGTGALAFGCDGQHSARAGGWGYLFGDEGSGFAIGAELVRAVTWASDGRGPATELTRLAFDQRRVDSVQQLVTQLYQATDPRQEVASLSRIVPLAAAKNDQVAQQIFQQATAHWHRLIQAVAARLNWHAGEPIPLAVAGGVVTELEDAPNRLTATIPNVGDSAFDCPSLVMHPVEGAMMLAIDLLRHDTDWLNIQEAREITFKGD